MRSKNAATFPLEEKIPTYYYYIKHLKIINIFDKNNFNNQNKIHVDFKLIMNIAFQSHAFQLL